MSIFRFTFADIAPNPIIAKGIYTVDSCKIQLVSETVSVELYHDSSKVECDFELLNNGDSVTIEIGFPEMNFYYLSLFEPYSENDKSIFQIQVNDKILTDKQIKVPEELDSIYKAYMYI